MRVPPCPELPKQENTEYHWGRLSGYTVKINPDALKHPCAKVLRVEMLQFMNAKAACRDSVDPTPYRETVVVVGFAEI